MHMVDIAISDITRNEFIYL